MSVIIYGRALSYGEVLLDRNEVAEQGAFGERLGCRDIAMLIDHDGEKPVGVWRDVWEKKDSVYCFGEVFDEETAHLCENRVLFGLSVGMNKIEVREDFTERSSILKGDIYEITLTPIPILSRARFFVAPNLKVLSRRQVESKMKIHDGTPVFPK